MARDGIEREQQQLSFKAKMSQMEKKMGTEKRERKIQTKA